MTYAGPIPHGTTNGYTNYGCRCGDCKRAQSKTAGHRNQNDCIAPTAQTSRCAAIAMHLANTEAAVLRVARLANRSEKAYAKYADDLRAAKQDRDNAYANRDAHMAECPAAADRFGASA